MLWITLIELRVVRVGQGNGVYLPIGKASLLDIAVLLDIL